MIKNRKLTSNFLDVLEKNANAVFTERQKIVLAKNKYLLSNKKEILQAIKEGYGYSIIAGTATEVLLKTGVASTVSFINKEGEEVWIETKYTAGEIKNFCKANEV